MTSYSYQNYFFFCKSPVKQVQAHTNFYTPRIVDGIFPNTFNTEGLLTHTVYPEFYGDRWAGKIELDFTYVKVKK